ncbi:MAG: YraN family protein [Phycisphaerales bacterium]|nr:YraN family protein [Phycisphaerales bacterium]
MFALKLWSSGAAGLRGRRLWDWLLDRDGRFGGDRDPLGLEGERLAAKFLRSAGYRVIGHNLLLPMGELDLLAVAPDERTIVAVEVKSRRVGGAMPGGVSQPAPEAAITAAKRKKLIAVTRHLTYANNWDARHVRIDVIAVEIAWGGGEPTIRHWPGVIRA